MGYLGQSNYEHYTWFLPQISQKGNGCTRTKEELKAYCPNICCEFLWTWTLNCKNKNRQVSSSMYTALLNWARLQQIFTWQFTMILHNPTAHLEFLKNFFRDTKTHCTYTWEFCRIFVFLSFLWCWILTRFFLSHFVCISTSVGWKSRN